MDSYRRSKSVLRSLGYKSFKSSNPRALFSMKVRAQARVLERNRFTLILPDTGELVYARVVDRRENVIAGGGTSTSVTASLWTGKEEFHPTVGSLTLTYFRDKDAGLIVDGNLSLPKASGVTIYRIAYLKKSGLTLIKGDPGQKLNCITEGERSPKGQNDLTAAVIELEEIAAEREKAEKEKGDITDYSKFCRRFYRLHH